MFYEKNASGARMFILHKFRKTPFKVPGTQSTTLEKTFFHMN
jgi:hypothetical protein